MWRYSLDPKLVVAKSGPVRGPYVVNVSTFDDPGIASFREQLQLAVDAEQGIVPVVIDSDGGSIDCLFAMYDELDVARRQGNSVATIVVGRACSAAADLLASGDRGSRFVSPHSRIMVHMGREAVEETRHVRDLKAQADEVHRQTDQSFDVFDRNCGKPRGYFVDLLRSRDQSDLYLSPREAVKLGIADHVGIPDLLVRVEVKIEIRPPGAAKKKRR